TSGELDLIYSDKVDLDPSGIPYQYPNGAIAQISYFDQELAIHYAQRKYLEKFSLTDAALLKKINIPSLEEDSFINMYNLGLS
ncbi:hypothetical protein ACWKSR_12580, partial [Campylobacter fetus subsp. venerealis]